LLSCECRMPDVNSGFIFAALAIVLIDVLLAGDNAVVIAMAVRSLPRQQRRMGVLAGAGGAVVLRVGLTFVASHILQLEFLKLIGGLLILWIAVRLVVDFGAEHEATGSASNLRQAIWMILVADVTMSLDNILAVAAVAKDNVWLLIAGLGLSITFVVFTSSLLSRLMDRFPILVWAGSAILGRVAGDMVVTDPWFIRMVHPSEAAIIGSQVLGAILVVAAGWFWKKLKKHKRVAVAK
jgi:YjbE family integral membrane protein